jgi:hypothetical protein
MYLLDTNAISDLIRNNPRMAEPHSQIGAGAAEHTPEFAADVYAAIS